MTENLPDQLGLNFSADEAAEGKLPRARKDVEITEQVYNGHPCYVLKDPASLRYYRLRPPEYTIFTMLDGKTAMEDVLRSLAERFPDEQYDAQAVMNFVVMLRGANLLWLPGTSDTDYLLRRKEMLTRNWFQRLRKEFLFYRLPVFDPDKLLNGLHDLLGGIVYSRFMSGATVLMLLGALVLLVQNIDKLGQRQPILSWANLLYLAPALLMIKFIHEFGHGLTAKHYESEVHEMGILFLVFTPMFYCDVSDAWMIGEKRRRMWITGAGIAVEVVMAGLACYVWALTEPKTVINQFALNVMIAGSVNTFLFNGNPLLRYDGYYFLMDLMEMPNLKQKGSGYLWYLFQHYVLGVERASEPIDVKGREAAVLGYAVCSAVYRWFIMFAIIAMVWRFLDPYGWGVLGGIMALGAIYSSFIAPIGKFFKFLVVNKHRMHLHLATAGILLALIVGSIYFVLAIPVEQSVDTQCVLRPQAMDMLYVSQPGFIQPAAEGRFVRDGDWVEEGEVLLALSEPLLEQEVADLELQVQQWEKRREQAGFMHASGRDVSAEMAQITAKIKGLQVQLDRARKDKAKLTIQAPRSGRVQVRTEEPLGNMVGRYLPLQSALFAVYDDTAFEAVAAVVHRDNGLIAVGQRAEIKLWPYDGELLDSEVVTKPPQPVWRMSSPAFSTAFGGEVATMPAAEAEEALEPAENTYEVVLPLQFSGPDGEANLPALRDGMVGRAKIIVEEKTLGRALSFWLIRTLRQDIRL